MKVIPVTYHSKKYPSDINSCIDEIAGNLDKESINPTREYSLHTEYSHMKRKLDSKLLSKYDQLKNCHKDFVPQLWKNKLWAEQFADFIIEIVGKNIPPKIIEIHPPFKDYCYNLDSFFEIYTIFEKKILKAFPNTLIFIENRCGTFYKGGKFLISKGKEIIEFLSKLSEMQLRLKLVLDYPQVFSAELIKMDNVKLDKIIKFNLDIKKYNNYIGGFHLWGKRKKTSNSRWVSHTGDLNDFFSNNDRLKEEFIKSIISTFDDDKLRFFVPEVNSSEEDLQSIITDLQKYGIIFVTSDT